MTGRSKQIKTYAGTETARKWREICARYSGNTAAFAVMVEQFHSQMEKFLSIRYGFHAADLLIGDDVGEYDERLSAAKYADLVETLLRQQYPEADVEIVTSYGTGGVLPESLRVAVDVAGFWETDHEEIGAIEQVAAQVYESYAWMVKSDDGG